MSYREYIDMFKFVQGKKCPYRAFTFDVVSSRVNEEYINKIYQYRDFILFVYNALLEEGKNTKTKIVLEDDFNKPYFVNGHDGIDKNINNPMVLGDNVTYFVYNGSISEERMIELFSKGLEKYNLNLSFHYGSGVYETNDYKFGGQQLFKGYMPQILEWLSKKSGHIITRESYLNIENIMSE